MKRLVFLGLFSLCLGFSSAIAENGNLWTEGNNSNSVPVINLPSFAPTVEALGKAVVNIRAEGREKDPLEQLRKKYSQQGQGQLSPFDFFFQMPEQGEKPVAADGSGFVIHPDGYIVTNYHVVQNALKIFVTFRDEKKAYKAELIGGDVETDVALLKVEHSGKLAIAPLGDSDKVQAGDWVIAIGNPFRLGHTATIGIVSAKSRKVGGKRYENFIQTDAAINMGNSGGPLFNAHGEVVGVNSMIYSPGGGYPTGGGFNIGIGFAAPINLVKTVISQLKDKGKVTRGLLGVKIQEVTEDIAESLKLKEPKGALVAGVIKDSPADKAGFKVSDVIVKYDGRDVQENDDLPLMVADTPIGKKVEIEVMRDGRKKSLGVVIEEQTEEKVESEPMAEQSDFGLSYQDINGDIAKSLGLGEDVEGVLVTGVDPETPAGKSGLKRGDVILEVDQKPVKSAKEFAQITKGLIKNVPLLLLVRRGSNTIFLTVKIES